MIVAGDVAGASGTGAHAGRGFDHGADHLRVLAHAEIIVRAPDHDLLRSIRRMPDGVGKTPGDALEVGKHAVAPFLVQAGKCGEKEMIIGHMAKSSSSLYSPIGGCRHSLPGPSTCECCLPPRSKLVCEAARRCE